MASSYITCRVLNRTGDRCTAEAVDENAELLICTRHLAEAIRVFEDALKYGPKTTKTVGRRSA